MKTVQCTVGQAIVKFLDQQFIEVDGVVTKYVEGVSVIFGHGIVLGLGEALCNEKHNLKVYQGKNEQGQAHMAMGYAKQKLRRSIIAVSASVGPGSANMVTAAATATANHIPLLLLPADTFATRQPDPVLQQIEQTYDLGISTNDAFKPVSKYFDRIHRPEQVMSAMLNAIRTLINPETCGAVTIAIPQDVQGEIYDYPETFFEKRIHHFSRRSAEQSQIDKFVEMLNKSTHPLIICGGGVRYSDAGDALKEFSKKYCIPVVETQAGKSSISCEFEYNLGGVGVTGNLAANLVARKSDLIIGLGTRMTDFTTGSKELFAKSKVVQVNVSDFQAMKLDAYPIVADAKTFLQQIMDENINVFSTESFMKCKKLWIEERNRLVSKTVDAESEVVQNYNKQLNEFKEVTNSQLTQTQALGIINDTCQNNIVVGASGSLPGDLQRMWQQKEQYGYHVEYGYSCMGYEVAAALGAKIAYPDKNVYSMVGDAAFIMLHSEIYTSLQENKKINICLFDNMSNGCINNLQMGNGLDSFCTDFRKRNESSNQLDGELLPVDFAKIAEGYGCKGYTIKTKEELVEALKDSESVNKTVLFDIKVLPKSMTHDYDSWWNVGLASQSNKKEVNECYEKLVEKRKNARRY